MSVNPLLMLYRTETRAAAAVLVEALAGGPGKLASPEALEQAAQRIKGAASIVGRTDAAALARAVEDAFTSSRRGVRPLDASRTEQLLNAIAALQSDADAALEPDSEPVDLTPFHQALDEPAAPVPPPPRVPAAPPPADDTASTLMELFRQEVRTLSAVLSDGLVTLETDSTDPRKIEPLMRAAHSIKGAARIVGCEPAVDLAHALEDLLVAGQSGAVRLSAADFDPLLAAVDALAELADANLSVWAAQNASRVQQCVAALEARLKGETLSPASPPAPAPPPPPIATAVVAPKPPGPIAPAPPSQPPLPTSPDADRVVRISAASLSRLLSLAGESLVEARWLQPFSQSLIRLKKQLDHLGGSLDELPTGVGDAARHRVASCRQVLADRIDEFEQHARRSDDLNSRLYREVIASRMRPFEDGTHGLARMVRDVARQLGKQVRFEVRGQNTDVDRDILDQLEAPLGHMLRNALDHGVESPADRGRAGKPDTATLAVEAGHHAGALVIRVRDDGRGVDLERLRNKIIARNLTSREAADRMSEAELLDFLFLPGFSTAESITAVSGRGVGLDAVQAMAQQVGGSARVHTQPGFGTTFELHLPITLSVLRALLVSVAGDPFALPLSRSDRLLRLAPADVRTIEGKPHFDADGRQIGLVPAHQIFELPATAVDPAADLSVLLVSDRLHQYGLIVDGFLGEQDLVVRPLDGRLGRVPNVAAAAVLDDGSPVLILDVDDVIRSAASLALDGRLRHQRPAALEAVRKKRVLVVDDSAIVREAERQLLTGRGYEVDLAVDGADGLNAVLQGNYDLVVSDVDMPRMTGLEFIKAVRADPRVQYLPVVMVSYKDRPEDRDRGREAGANYYLTKSSFHDGQFLDAIEELIGPPD